MELRALPRSSIQIASLLGSLLWAGCAADLSRTNNASSAPLGTITASGSAINAENLTTVALSGMKVSFRSSDYYSIFLPQPTSQCAGDANTFYDPLNFNTSGKPATLATSLADSSTTIRPAFIKNVSVDITDSNLAIPTNKAFGCSYGQSVSAPPPSNCATFDGLGSTFISLTTSADGTLLIGGAPQEDPYYLSSGNQIVYASAAFGHRSVVLPPAVLNVGKIVFVEKTDSSTNWVTIKTTNTDTISDLTSQSVSLKTAGSYASYTATANGTGSIPPYYWALNTYDGASLTSDLFPLTLPAANGTPIVVEYDVDASNASGDLTLTLPTAASSSGHVILIRKTDSTANNIIVVPSTAADKIIDDAGTNYSQTTPYIVALDDPEVALLAIGTGTPHWTTQNPEPNSSTFPYGITAGNQIVLIDATNSDVTLQLPSALVNPGKVLVLERLDSVSTHTVTVNSISPETMVDLTSTSTTLGGPSPSLTLTSTPIAANSLIYYWKATTGVPYRASVGFNSGYYTMIDSACVQSGPIYSVDPTVNKSLVGGAYIDLDRTQLGANENLLLNLTFFPLGAPNTSLNQTVYSSQESPAVKIHLVKTGQSGNTIRGIAQPRILTYGASTQFPDTVQDLAIIGQPGGQIQQAQVFLPISVDPGIDRIHIQRYIGNIIFIDAAVYRMGNH